MKRSITILVALISVVVVAVVASNCAQWRFLNRAEWILKHNSDEIEEKYGEFDIVDTEPDTDGRYKSTTCSYIIQNEDTTMLLCSIRFDDDGRARACYFEKVFTDDENTPTVAPFQIDAGRTDLPAQADTERIKEGMSASEVYAILGKPQRDVGSGTVILEWDLDSGEVFTVSFVLEPDDEWRVAGCAITAPAGT